MRGHVQISRVHGRGCRPTPLPKITVVGGQGDAPLGLPPPLGERGGHPSYFHKNNREQILYWMRICTFNEIAMHAAAPEGAPRRIKRRFISGNKEGLVWNPPKCSKRILKKMHKQL
jgi:hypothetical protein